MVNSVGPMGATRVGKLFRDFDCIRAVNEILFEVHGSNGRLQQPQPRSDCSDSYRQGSRPSERRARSRLPLQMMATTDDHSARS